MKKEVYEVTVKLSGVRDLDREKSKLIWLDTMMVDFMMKHIDEITEMVSCCGGWHEPNIDVEVKRAKIGKLVKA